MAEKSAKLEVKAKEKTPKRSTTAVKNISFTRELLVASGVKKNVHEASQGWAFDCFGVSSGYLHCQLCHAKIVNFAVIRRAENAMRLTIGHDCLEKLGNLQRTGLVESVSSTLPTWKNYRSTVRAYIRESLEGKRDIVAAVTKWLAAEKELPEHLRETLTWLEKFGAPESNEKAQALVTYYKTHRKFPAKELLGDSKAWSYRYHVHSKLLPKEVTIVQLPKLLHVLERGRAIAERRNERRMAEDVRLRKESEEKIRAEQLLAWSERIDAEVHTGRLIRKTLELGANPRTGFPEWKVRYEGKLCVLGYNERYDPSEGAVLCVPYEIPEKNITILFRAYLVEEYGGRVILAYRDQTGAKQEWF